MIVWWMHLVCNVFYNPPFAVHHGAFTVLCSHPKIAVLEGPGVLTVVPYAHAAGLWQSLFGLTLGFEIHVMARFDLELFLKTIEERSVSVLFIYALALRACSVS